MAWTIAQSDVDEVLATLPNVELTGSFDYDRQIAAAVQEFETRTSRWGFQDGGTKTLTYDAPDGRDGTLDLFINDFSAVSEVAVGGVTWTENTDYLLHRWRENDDSTPFVRIEFLRAPVCDRRQISVTGTRGYGDLPADIETAIVERVAASAVASTFGASGPVKREKLGAQEEERDLSKGQDFISRATAGFDRVCAIYARFQ